MLHTLNDVVCQIHRNKTERTKKKKVAIFNEGLPLHNGNMEEYVQDPGHTLGQLLLFLCPLIALNEQWQPP